MTQGAVAGDSPRPGAPDPAVARSRVLVVDDVEANRDLLVRRLRRLGITEVSQAEDGRAALELIRAAPFDLVLLDIMMPIMTGFDVLEALTAEGRIEGLPVIVISAMGEMDAIVRAIGLGAEDFLLKPFDPLLLKARVLATLEKKRMRDHIRAELARRQIELAQAHDLQLSLVPPPYADANCRIESVLVPAREVGGDLVDHMVLAGGHYLVVLGDVSDKGAGAALVMARTHALIRSLAVRPDALSLFSDPARAVAELNDMLCLGNRSCMFVTMLLAVFDANDGSLAYVRCGHIPPYVRRADGSIDRLEVHGGLPLGAMDGMDYVAGSARLAPGDALLLLTDGVTEAEAPDGSMFEEEGVADWLAAGPTRLGDLIERVRRHEDGGPPSDDMALLMLFFDKAACSGSPWPL